MQNTQKNASKSKNLIEKELISEIKKDYPECAN